MRENIAIGRANSLLQSIVGSPGDFPLDARILNGIGFVTAFLALIAMVFNRIMSADDILLYPCLVGIGLGTGAWYLGRIQKQFFLSLALLIFTQLGALNLTYLVNGGLNGPAALFFATLTPIYIFILRPSAALPITVFLLVNVAVLFAAESHGLINPLPLSQVQGPLSHFVTHLLNFSLILLVAVTIKWLFLREQRKAEENNEAKTRFLANISHEIRTPMNAILGMTEMALSKSTDPQQKKWLDGTQIAATHLLSLLEDMLDISSIDAGRLPISNEQFNLPALTKNTVDILRGFAADKQLELDTNIDSALPQQVMSDPVRLRQILVNLINNAIKFTEKGIIHVSAHRLKNDNDHVVCQFSVSDTGIGINPDDRAQIFDMFTRGQNINGSQKGSGLGLSIAKQLVEKMGGEIWLQDNSQENNRNAGTTITFTLPVEEIPLTDNSSNKGQNEAGELSAPLTPTDGATRTEAINILLVEDNEINVDVAKHMLLKAGYSVDICSNGEESLEKLAKVKYSAVLMDLEMPIMDGCEATMALRNGMAGPLNQYTPVIAVTAHALPSYREKAYNAGVQGFVTKPIIATALVEAINEALSNEA